MILIDNKHDNGYPCWVKTVQKLRLHVTFILYILCDPIQESNDDPQKYKMLKPIQNEH